MAPALPRLHLAAARGHEGKLQQFIAAGDDVNARDPPDGRTPLLEAIIGGQTKCVRILLAAGADPSISDNAKVLPLSAAAQTGNVAIARALLRANADGNAIPDRPQSGTALCIAAFKGDKAMVKLLLDAGCDPSKTVVGGQHPLTISSMEGHIDVVTMLLAAGADVSALDSDGVTALMMIGGVYGGHSKVVKILLENGANANSISPNGRPALHMAAQHGFDEVINVLVAAGAAVDQTEDQQRRTPLHSAAHSGHPKCALALLRAGANVLARDVEGLSPLHMAASKGDTDVIEVLLEAGAHADVNLVDNENRTPLGSAVAFADTKAVNLLLDAGADINQVDAAGQTALFFVIDAKVVRVLLDRGADVRVLDSDGATVLHSAGYRGMCVAVICSLFKAGADPTVTIRTGETAADLARKEGHEDAAKLLDLLEAKYRSLNTT